MSAVDDLRNNILTFRYNPAGIQSTVLNLLTQITNGEIDVVDPTNPFVFLLEGASTMTAAFMAENKVLNRFQYPSAAQSVEELYPHMSDKDFVGVFAKPSSVPILLGMNKNELINNLVPLNDGSGVSQLIIPRNTTVTIADTYVFSLQYPIMIRQLSHGGLQIIYDVSQTTPLQTLSSNIIPWAILRDTAGQEIVTFEVVMSQFDIISKTAAASQAQPMIITANVTDQYYYTRVWVDNGDNTFTEIPTTYTDATYDIQKPTAVVKVMGKVVQVKIPQIYITTGLLNKNIRADIYQTKGALDINLSNYTQDKYITKFFAVNASDYTVYTAPLAKLKTFVAYSIKSTSGGNSELGFDDLKQRVITNSIGSQQLPITNVQIEQALSRANYSVVKNIDSITNRNFLATRPMPDPTDPSLITAASAGIGVLSAKVADALTLNSVIDNNDGYTLITPNTLYKYKSGVMEFVASAETAALKTMTPDQLSLAISTGSYMYSPFHYVMDSSQNEFHLRPYYLDNPFVNSKSFISENDTTLLQVSTNSFSVTRTDTGYKLTVVTLSSSDFQNLTDSEVYVQLAYVPPGEVDRAYLLGTLVGKTSTNERIYEFDLSTNFSINPDHQLGMTEFQMFNTTERVVRMPLKQTFDIVYSTNASMGTQWRTASVDSILGQFQLPNNIKGVVHEQIDITFGYFLNHLWSRSRTVVSANQYETWAVDVPAVYENDVYQPDPVTGLAFTIVNGELTYNKIHSQGDPVVDGNGDPVYKHRKGDVKLDAYGQPIIVQGRDLLRQMDLFMVDATYYFATNQVALNYRKELINTVVNWLVVELEDMGDKLLEQTSLFYYPTTTLGSVDVLYGASLTTTIAAGQSFVVELFVNDNVYTNLDLRQALETKTISTINEALQSQTVAVSNIIDAMKVAYANDVIAINLTGLGGSANLDVVTVLDGSRRLSLNKKLVARSDSTLAVAEDVTINFIRYNKSH